MLDALEPQQRSQMLKKVREVLCLFVTGAAYAAPSKCTALLPETGSNLRPCFQPLRGFRKATVTGSRAHRESRPSKIQFWRSLQDFAHDVPWNLIGSTGLGRHPSLFACLRLFCNVHALFAAPMYAFYRILFNH